MEWEREAHRPCLKVKTPLNLNSKKKESKRDGKERKARHTPWHISKQNIDPFLSIFDY
jgi:hypothetical protein